MNVYAYVRSLLSFHLFPVLSVDQYINCVREGQFNDY